MTPDDPQEAQARRGLDAWAAFPADREPRPLVLLDTIPAVRPSGLLPDKQTEMALLHGVVDAVPGFPAPVLEALRGRPGAYAGPEQYAGPPLLLTDAVLGSFRYETDRGPRVLPTWEVHAQGVFQPFQVLDPAAISRGQVWEPPGRKRITGLRPTVTLAADGRTLTMSYSGSGWYADSNQAPARTLESGNAVALVFTERRKPRRSGWYADVGRRREVTAVLPSPLANRVLLDAKGGPVMVT
ncbi:MAG: hypothetical protein ACRDP7_43065, partial [Trebonia sp.]